MVGRDGEQAAILEAAICAEALPTSTEGAAIEEFPFLSNGVRAWMKFKESDYRSPGFHPSGFSSWCAREKAYEILAIMSGDKVLRIRPDASTMLRFQAGNAAHLWFQARIFGDMGVLCGMWRCYKCGHVHGASDNNVRIPKLCEKCGAGPHALWFKESAIEIPASKVLGIPEDKLTAVEKELYRIVGHHDGMLRIKGHPDMVAEIKSEDSELWKRRQGPEAAHIIQGLLYAYAAKVDFVAVIYVNKNTYDIKTYKVGGAARNARDRFKDIREVRKAVGLVQPEKLDRACPDDKHHRAKRCPFRKICFST